MTQTNQIRNSEGLSILEKLLHCLGSENFMSCKVSNENGEAATFILVMQSAQAADDLVAIFSDALISYWNTSDGDIVPQVHTSLEIKESGFDFAVEIKAATVKQARAAAGMVNGVARTTVIPYYL